jgi:hypothetical protein
MKPSQCTIAGPRMVILYESYRDSCCDEIACLIGFHEKAAIIAKGTRLNDHQALYGRRIELERHIPPQFVSAMYFKYRP